MRKLQKYEKVRFDSQTILAAEKSIRLMSDKEFIYMALDIDATNTKWSYDTLDQFLAAMVTGTGTIGYHIVSYGGFSIAIDERKFPEPYSSVAITAPTQEQIESISLIFNQSAEAFRKKIEREKGIKVFIGHGRNDQWRDLKDHLRDHHGYQIEAYEIGSRTGYAITEILKTMLKESSFALLVMTGEDQMKKGGMRARQNVVHEAGLFQGRLGFDKALILLEKGTEDFSNVAGIDEIRFSKGKIKETYGPVLAALARVNPWL